MKLKDESLESRGVFQQHKPGKINITWISGKIYISLPSYKLNLFSYHFYFALHLEMRLNMTFFVLHLSEITFNCNNDKLEIKILKITNLKYKYCGYHSNFNFYPEFDIFTMIITLRLRMAFLLNTVFSVTDKELIVNPVHSPSLLRHLLVINFIAELQCYKVGIDNYVTSFHVKGLKFYRLHLSITNSKVQNYVICDGPGYAFDILNKNAEKLSFSTSTFQCLVQFLLNYLFQGRNNDQLFNYHPIMLDYSVQKWFYPNSDILIQMPFIKCPRNFCVHIVRAGHYYQLNVTVLNISVQSHETSICLFQGLFLGETWQLHQWPIDEMCLQLSPSSVTSMSSFHTRKSSLWMVLYWYEGHTSINATVSVNITKCQGIYLNICAYYNFCHLDDDEFSFINFMYTQPQHTKIHFSDCYTYLYKQFFKIPPGECAVLILTDKVFPFIENMYQYFVVDSCEILLASTSSENKFNYINGFLTKGNYLEVVEHKDCISSKHPMCGKILKARSVSEFKVVKFTNRFRHHFSNEIDYLLAKVHSGPTRNQINIKLTGLRIKKTKCNMH